MMTRDSIWVLIVGLLISMISFGLIYFKEGLWYFPAVIGILMIFDYFSSITNKDTSLQLFWKHISKFKQWYILMFFLGATIECIGRFIFNLWNYPFQTNILLEFALLLFYPLILMSFREMYESIKIILKNRILLFIFSMILGIIIWEVPNLFIYSWVYTIPFVNLEIFKINVIVIVGWAVLIGFPVWIYNKFFGDKK